MNDENYISEMSSVAHLERRNRREFLYQDLGILLFLLSLAAMILAITLAPESRQMEAYVMFALSCGSILLAAYRYSYIAVSTAALQVLFFTTYRIYLWKAQNAPIGWVSYVWIFAVPLAAIAMNLFQWVGGKSEKRYAELTKTIQNLVLIDSLTGLYNQKALYIDLERQMAYSVRNNIPLTLMCIRLRYAQELKDLLGKTDFEDLLRRFSDVLENQVRLEDRVYSIDDNGTFALILSCDKAGAEAARTRLKANIVKPEHYEKIISKPIRVHTQCACLQFDKEKHTDAFLFKRLAESELQHDV